MALTREDGVRAGMILLSPGNWEQVRFDWEDRSQTVERFLEIYKDDSKEAINIGFSWKNCATLLANSGIDITEDMFEQYYDEQEDTEFFDTMFQTMLRPFVSKPLEDYL